MSTADTQDVVEPSVEVNVEVAHGHGETKTADPDTSHAAEVEGDEPRFEELAFPTKAEPPLTHCIDGVVQQPQTQHDGDIGTA